jgi:hypothetical protein
MPLRRRSVAISIDNSRLEVDVKRGTFIVIVLFVAFAAPMIAQVIENRPSTAPLPTGAKQRDQEALLILSGTIGAAGGVEQLTTIRDLTETGTVTYYWSKEVTGNVTVKSQGHDRLKIDADLPTGKQITVIGSNGGTIIEPNGSRIPINGQSITDLGNLTMPSLALLEAMRDSSVGLVYAGMVTHNGSQVYDVRVMPSFPQAQDLKGKRSTDEARDFYIDTKTLLVTSITDSFHLGGRKDTALLHELSYSNYQLQNGVMAPLAITESVSGNPGLTMTLTQVSFNPGLAPADFSW